LLKYDNTVSSTATGQPIYGAQVSVYEIDANGNNGAAASLYADEAGTTPLSQPLLTDQAGYFAFYIGDGRYNISVMTGPVEISRTNITMVDSFQLKQRALLVPVNEDSGVLPGADARKGMLLGFDQQSGAPTAIEPDELAGPPGPADNTYTSYAAMQASDPTRKSARLVGDTDVPAHPDGPYNNPTQTLGGWVPQTGQGIAFAQAGANPISSDLQTEVRRFVWAEQYGFAPNRTGAQNQASLQRAIDEVYARGGGVLRIGSGAFPIDGFVRWKPGVALLGSGSKTTVLKQTNVSPQTIRHGFEGVGGGVVGFSGFSVIGRGQANDLPSFFDEKAINIGRTDDASGPNGVEQAIFDDVEIGFSRGMCIGAQGEIIIARNCYLHHGFRDGFNFSGSRRVEVTGCTTFKLADDAIAVHIVRGQTGVIDTEIRIIGNRCERSLGIKALGARNTVIALNTLRFCAAYSIEVDADPSTVSGEGIGAKFGVVIANNSILDPIGAFQIGSQGLATAIQVGGVAFLGTSPAFAGYDGSYANEGLVVTPEYTFLNFNDPVKPRPANRTFVIEGNVIQSTLGPAASFADLGFGTLWSPQGDINPAPFAGTIRACRGIQLDGDFRNFLISGNAFDGLDTAIVMGAYNILDGILVQGNTITRCRSGASINNSGMLSGEIVFKGNRFDLDPYCELPGHQLSTGQWTDFSGVLAAALFVMNHRGVIMTGNTMSNLRQPLQGSEQASVSFCNNDLFWDWSVSGQSRGIGYTVDSIYGNNHYFRYSAPIDPAFNKFSTAPDSAFVRAATTMPSSGLYVQGQFVDAINPPVEAGRLLRGWRRVTTGSAHTIGTDWRAVYDWDGLHPSETPPPA